MTLEELGTGTHAVVFRGKWGKRDVALKKLKPGQQGEDSEAEAKLLNVCNHKNVVKVHGVFLERSSQVIVTELCEHRSLVQLFRCEDVTEIFEAYSKKFILETALGMEHIHQLNIIHR